MIKEELTRVFAFTREIFQCASTVFEYSSHVLQKHPGFFRMVEVSPRVFGFSFAIDRRNTFRTSVRGFFSEISILVDSVVVLTLFFWKIGATLSFIFSSFSSSISASKWFFCNVNISTFFCRSFEVVDNWGLSSNRKDTRCPCLVFSASQICLWTFIMAFAWCLWSSTKHFGVLSLQRDVCYSCFSYLFISNY